MWLGLILGCLVNASPGGDGTPKAPQIDLVITAPADGSQWKAGEPIHIQATAVSSLGGVYRLEFLDGTHRIGVSEILTLVAIPPGQPAHHEFLWRDAPVGRHSLRVQAAGPEFPVLSAPVTVWVGESKPAAQVVLTHPGGGTILENPDVVELVAEATDPEGILDVVEFSANGELIGTSHIDFCPPCPSPPICPLGPCILPPIGATLTHRVIWERPLPGKYALTARALRQDGQSVDSKPVHVSVVRAGRALLAWDSPEEGSLWIIPGVVPLQITAVDPDGEIRRVEFFANEKQIGVSEIRTRDVEIPGRPRTHFLTWSNPPVGNFSLHAKAVARAGNVVVSPVRRISVTGNPAIPVLRVETLVGTAVEGRVLDDGTRDSLRFRIHRVGGLQRPVNVFFHFEGDAKPDVDYSLPEWNRSLAAGQLFADLVVEPLDDRLSEGSESVILILDPSPTMGPVDPYRIDPSRGKAVGVIEDDEPVFTFQQPEEGAAFPSGSPVFISVLTTWSPDFVSHLEFLADGQRIGDSVVNFIQAPPPGTPVVHSFEWIGAPAGKHRLTVRSLLADGSAVESADVRNILVEGSASVPEVGLKVVDGMLTEGNADGPDPAEVLVRRSGDLLHPLTVYLQWLGTATPGVDFGPAPTEVQFPAGKAEVPLRLIGYPDDLVEGDETIELSIIHPPTLPGVILYRTSANTERVRLLLHDGTGQSILPVVTVRTGNPYALEGDRFNRGEFVLNRSGDLSKDVDVQIAFSGSARRGSDFHVLLDPCDDCAAPDQELTGDVVHMPAGLSTRVLGILANADSRPGENEPVLEDIELRVLTPPVPAVLGARPAYVAGVPDRAMVQVVNRINPQGAELILIAPQADDWLPRGGFAELRAIAVDPHGSVRRVEFLANGRGIGVSEITTEEVDVPGRLRVHTFRWALTDAVPAGRYLLATRAASSGGLEIRSADVPVVVRGTLPDLPVVTLTQGKSPAFERGDLKSRTGGFVVTRKGDLSLPLTVFVSVSGTATPGVDYQWQTGVIGGGGDPATDLPAFGAFLPVTFAPRIGETTVHFTATPDDRSEGRETVVLQLMDSPILAIGFPDFPILPATYRIGDPREAGVVIEDSSFDLPFISLGEPAHGDSFRVGTVIHLAATAARPGAGVESIQFLADGDVIGTVDYCCDVCDCPPAPPGRAFTARFEWTGARSGTHVLTARTVIGPGRWLESDPVKIVVSGAEAGSLVIVDPPEGAVFPVGHSVTIDTVGQAPDSLVSTVEFFANGQKIGETCFLCVVDAFFQPGTPLHNVIQWAPKVPGRYELTAVGQFGPDRRIKSPSVAVQVDGGVAHPQLTIVDPLDGASVPAGSEFAVTAVGVGREGGITDTVLLVDGRPMAESRLVFIRPPGANEEVRHQFRIRLEAGPHQLTVQDLEDATVVSKRVGVTATKGVARITWVGPLDGAVFDLGKPILLEVEAVDPDGLIFNVEFFDGNQSIGTSEFNCPTCRFAPGAVIPHRLEWRGASVGRHVLTVRATRADGTPVSSSVRRVNVRGGSQSDSFVTRVLPQAYSEGQAMTVSLVARPNPGTAAYVVEELPPHAFPAPGPTDQAWPIWRVVSISHDGQFDPLTGKVKFGPFFDAEPRTLTYRLIPGLFADVARFDGVGVADGIASPIGGDFEIRENSRHPADNQIADDSIQATELTAYAAAWRRAQSWPGGPSPIPVEYVTRAALLWKGGEHYIYNPASGPPPFCWVNGFVPVPVDQQGADMAPLAGLALRTADPQADGTLRVTIRVTPAPGTRAFAVEESLPAVGTVSEISGEGAWDSGSRTVRWGPFFAGEAPVMGYVLTGAPVGLLPGGIASFDGQNVSIHSESGSKTPDGTAIPWVGVDALHDGSLQVSLKDNESGGGVVAYELQASGDLKHWTTLGVFKSGPDAAAAFARDSAAAGSEVRFYRAVRRP